ncbi:hypothetical protein T07_6015 [Trichinella nelsoni]|uniref:Uncharacterized protein n=1 Tax=Trichinella nelsoni TaxID=6336 RepID=A0A0V0RX81_9BILA|nr:hypothetical protein T07_6015 [Trichinella nelsoni]
MPHSQRVVKLRRWIITGEMEHPQPETDKNEVMDKALRPSRTSRIKNKGRSLFNSHSETYDVGRVLQTKGKICI